MENPTNWATAVNEIAYMTRYWTVGSHHVAHILNEYDWGINRVKSCIPRYVIVGAVLNDAIRIHYDVSWPIVKR